MKLKKMRNLLFFFASHQDTKPQSTQKIELQVGKTANLKYW